MKYPAYPAYASTGSAVMQRLPKKWRLNRLRFVTKGIEQGWSPQCDNAMADEDAWGVMKVGCVNGHRFNAYENKALPAELEPMPEYELQAGDILISRANTKELVGSAAVVPTGVRAKLMLCDKLFRIKPEPEVCGEFLTYFLRTPVARFHYERDATGASGSMQNIGQDTLKELAVPLPLRDEQEHIAAFLDWKTAQIDTLIAKKQDLIAKLKEKRMAVITHAVTKGLDPAVLTRDSGIPWLGAVPAHWDVVRYGYRTKIQEGQVDPDTEPFSDMLMIAPNHIESHTGRMTGVTSAHDQGAISGKYLVSRGDVVYSKIRPHLNKCALALFDGLCSADMYPIRTEQNLSAEFLLNWMLAQPFLDYASESSMRVAMPKLNRDTLNAAPLVVPPPEEQTSIVSHLDRVTRKIDGMLDKAMLVIDRLTEYRTALITAAVTGQIDVRHITIPTPA